MKNFAKIVNETIFVKRSILDVLNVPNTPLNMLKTTSGKKWRVFIVADKFDNDDNFC